MKKLALLDFCISDYFTGYSRPVIAIPVYGSMTNKEVAEAISDEIDAIYDYLISGYSRTELLLMDHYCEQLMTDPENIFVTQDEMGYEYEPAYLYLGIIKPVYRYGLQFLNA